MSQVQKPVTETEGRFWSTARRRGVSLDQAMDATENPDATVRAPNGATWFLLGEVAYLTRADGTLVECRWAKKVEGVRVLSPSGIRVGQQVHRLMVSRRLDSDDVVDAWEDPLAVFAPHHTDGTWRLGRRACWLFDPAGGRVVAIRAPRIGALRLARTVSIHDAVSGHTFEVDSVLGHAVSMLSRRGLEFEDLCDALEDAERIELSGCTLCVHTAGMVVKVDPWGTVLSGVSEGEERPD